MKIRNTLILGLVLTALTVFLMMGVSATGSTQNSPADNTWDSDRIVNFNCSGSGNATNNLANITLYIDGVLNVTNSTINSATNQTVFVITFIADSCTGRNWACDACDNVTTCNSTANRTIKLDATTPTVSCDLGSNYIGLKKGDYVTFTDSDTCGISTRTWSNDLGVTTSSSYVSADNVVTNDVDTNQWTRGDYTVNSTVCDAAGLCADAKCYIWLKQSTQPKTVSVETQEGGEVALGEGGSIEVKSGEVDKNPILLFVILLAGAFFVLTHKGERRKKRK